jgi:predicted nucleotide-binding protein
MTGGDTREGWDFFLSYTQADKAWAEWVAWVLEEDGHRVLIQAWDFVPGTNWILGMQAGIDKSTRTIAILSEDYLASVYGSAEWQATWALDPAGALRSLLIVRVADCPRRGLLGAVVGVDLFGLDDAAATAQLRAMIKAALSGRAKPSVKPQFPGATRAVPQEPQFPGPEEGQATTSNDRRPHKAIDEATSFGTNRKGVLVIYGHDSKANDALYDWLRAIGLQPLEWSQLVSGSGGASPYIGQVLDKALEQAQAVIVFFTPDEWVVAASALQDEEAWRPQARPNVLIEAGIALATHPDRTILVVLGSQELASDLAGRHYIRLDPDDAIPLYDLAERLRVAGCDTDLTGTDWLVPTRFPDRNASKPPPGRRAMANEELADKTPHRSAPEAEAQRAKDDTDARQVTVVTEPKPGPNYTHLITVSAPITYPIKQVEGQIAWQLNSGFGMTGFGFSGDPPRVDDRHRRYTFRASVSPQIHNPEPVIRFVDLHGHRYYQFRHHTQRFPQNTDWPHAVSAIDQWLRTGPSPA